jgi:hypothetical protein
VSRFLFASTPATAHSWTPRPIVRRLVERGHEVAWYAGQAFAPRVRAAGARHEPFVEALDFSGHDPFDRFPHLRQLDGLEAIKASFRDVFLALIETTVAELVRILGPGSATVVRAAQPPEDRVLRSAARFAFRDVDAEYTAIRSRLGLHADPGSSSRRASRGTSTFRGQCRRLVGRARPLAANGLPDPGHRAG